MNGLALPPLGLYIHLPWCVRKCPYCDFNSHAAPEELPERAYVEALLADLEQDLPAVWGRTVHSVFIGGGTPSLFSPSAIEALLSGVRARLALSPEAEITLEANPGTVECAPPRAFREAGVNRFSLGVQSFDDSLLSAIGRIHDGAAARSAVADALAAGFDHVNVDLMFGLPGQSLAQALADLDHALSLGPDHLSHYQLTLEPNTLFHRRPPAGLPDDDLAWTMQCEARSRLAQAGYLDYEISAYARPGSRCRHNLNYWQFGDYLGIGCGAHGKLTHPGEGRIERLWKERHPRRYLETAGRPASVGGRWDVAPREVPFEFALNVFRLRDGIPSRWFTPRTGLELDLDAPPWAEALSRGWLIVDDHLRASDEGRRWLNDLQSLFLPDQGPPAVPDSPGPASRRAIDQR